eukprot:scaffold23498_cov62-Attheya_sp.AAC.5
MENKLGEFDLHDLDEKSLLTELQRAQADYRSIGEGADEHRRPSFKTLLKRVRKPIIPGARQSFMIFSNVKNSDE